MYCLYTRVGFIFIRTSIFILKIRGHNKYKHGTPESEAKWFENGKWNCSFFYELYSPMSYPEAGSAFVAR